MLAHEDRDDLGDGWLQQNSAGAAPWTLRSWRANEAVALDANARHPMATDIPEPKEQHA